MVSLLHDGAEKDPGETTAAEYIATLMKQLKAELVQALLRLVQVCPVLPVTKRLSFLDAHAYLPLSRKIPANQHIKGTRKQSSAK